MKNIAIDLEVYKELEKRREHFEESYNDILRRLFKIKPIVMEATPTPEKKLSTKGGELPEGLQLRGRHMGAVYYAEVRHGKILYKGVLYTSPSSAAYAVTNTSRNGWFFWDYLKGDDPNRDECWRPLDQLRGKKKEPRLLTIKGQDSQELKLLSLIQQRWSVGDLFHLRETYDFEEQLRPFSRAKDIKANIRYYLRQKLCKSGYIKSLDNRGTYKRLR